MSERINDGDRVRIVIEGEYRQIGLYVAERFEGELPEGSRFQVAPGDRATIEKIEPPVQVFEPGDIIRWRHDDAMVFVLGHEGYLDLYNDGIWNPYLAGSESQFTSKDYELVEV